MTQRDYRVLVDTECPLSQEAYVKWAGFSEEGQLMTLDTEGVLRSFNFSN